MNEFFTVVGAAVLGAAVAATVFSVGGEEVNVHCRDERGGWTSTKVKRRDIVQTNLGWVIASPVPELAPIVSSFCEVAP